MTIELTWPREIGRVGEGRQHVRLMITPLLNYPRLAVYIETRPENLGCVDERDRGDRTGQALIGLIPMDRPAPFLMKVCRGWLRIDRHMRGLVCDGLGTTVDKLINAVDEDVLVDVSDFMRRSGLAKHINQEPSGAQLTSVTSRQA